MPDIVPSQALSGFGWLPRVGSTQIAFHGPTGKLSLATDLISNPKDIDAINEALTKGYKMIGDLEFALEAITGLETEVLADTAISPSINLRLEAAREFASKLQAFRDLCINAAALAQTQLELKQALSDRTTAERNESLALGQLDLANMQTQVLQADLANARLEVCAEIYGTLLAHTKSAGQAAVLMATLDATGIELTDIQERWAVLDKAKHTSTEEVLAEASQANDGGDYAGLLPAAEPTNAGWEGGEATPVTAETS